MPNDDSFPLPASQQKITALINGLASRHAAGDLLSVFAVAETVDGRHIYFNTRAENAYARAGFILSCGLNQLGFAETNAYVTVPPEPGQTIPPTPDEENDDEEEQLTN